jgi:hypothetical protein
MLTCGHHSQWQPAQRPDRHLHPPAVSILLLLLIKIAPSCVNQQQRGQLSSSRTAAAGWQVCKCVPSNRLVSLQQPLQQCQQDSVAPLAEGEKL